MQFAVGIRAPAGHGARAGQSTRVIARAPEHPSAVCHRDAAYGLFMAGVPVPDPTAVATAVQELITGPCLLVSPWRHDRHPDHEACGLAAVRAARFSLPATPSTVPVT